MPRNKRLQEIEARKSAILAEIDTADEARMAELEAEVDALNAEEAQLRRRGNLAGKLGEAVGLPGQSGAQEGDDDAEQRAANFARTKRMAFDTRETRSILVSTGDIATPTTVSGIYDTFNASPMLPDLVNVVDMAGASGNTFAYVDTEGTAKAGTEGEDAEEGGTKFSIGEITAKNYDIFELISREIAKQSPLKYQAKVTQLAHKALRRKAAEMIVEDIIGSDLSKPLVIGAVAADTLRKIALEYGSDDAVEGGAHLVLCKADLQAYGALRSDDGKAVLEIVPDANNSNCGTIRDGGLVVPYMLSSKLAAGQQIYGQLKGYELDLFGQFEVRVSEDYAFRKKMNAILGDVTMGGAVTRKHGFIVTKTA